MAKIVFTQEEILTLLPHRDPFLFVNRITRFRAGKAITAEYDIDPEGPHFKGHFPGHPIMPGALVTDSLAQTAGLLWGFTKREREPGTMSDKPELFYLAADSMKYVEPAKPGETLTMNAQIDSEFGGLYKYKVEASVGRRIIAKGELTLAVKEGEF